ncbi:MAG TPA: methionine--tRNA ligase subunit beta [Candidatus Nanoarchaeia archaeon]|nr:methionine--tRNA ligase subunit beta [Candidatus Nanoarchaeia archaeon]
MTSENIVNFEDWEKLDLRVAKIVKVEEIDNADKLYKLEVDLGKEIGKRTICAGIKQYYSKDELKGKKIVVLANLEPRKMRGIESQGMLLASDNEKGKVILLTPESDIEVGSKVR